MSAIDLYYQNTNHVWEERDWQMLSKAIEKTCKYLVDYHVVYNSYRELPVWWKDKWKEKTSKFILLLLFLSNHNVDKK